MMTTSEEIHYSPMMAQWLACKKKATGAIVLFRLGDFYEAFEEDALLLSRELELTLTKRQEIPMCGVPFHTSETYIDRLVAKGYRVAIAEQLEDPKQAKGLVHRDIVRMITPGTTISSNLLLEKTNNFFASLTQVNSLFGLALLDLTTADFWVLELDSEQELLDELFRLRPTELLVSEKFSSIHPGFLELIKKQLSCAINIQKNWLFDHQSALDFLLRHFHVHTLEGFGLKSMTAAINAAGAVLSYVKEELNVSITHIQHLRKEELSQYLSLDVATQRHLELIESIQGRDKKNTLLSLLDLTKTPMGGRLLKQWLTHPLLSVHDIQRRQQVVCEFLTHSSLNLPMSRCLNEIRDLERLIMRIETGYASPRDLVALRFSLEHVPSLFHLLQSLSAPLLQEHLKHFYDVGELTEKIKKALVETPPLRLSEGGIFKAGYHPELDELKSLQGNSFAWIDHYQAHLRESTQIKTLKVGFTKAFGYYIEVSRGQAMKVPDYFQRRQTLVNAERFITPELKEYEYKMLHAEDRISALEQELFHQLRKEIAAHSARIRSLASAIAHIDCLFAFAERAKNSNYVCPYLDESDCLEIKKGRHPVIEAYLSHESFIPNDVTFDASERLLLITGPNMAGKSTFIRQVALIVIMAQMGSFVPAEGAHIGIVDKVFSRIGASDDLSRGQSTFMVEMIETANILHHASKRSLVILDEIGRGTSTYDGISIAWAVAEHLLAKQAKTLFATHYWELTELEKKVPGAINFNVAVHETEKEVVFLRKIVRGGTDKSYGIHVARLAGFPPAVLKRAQDILHHLESKESPHTKKTKKPDAQLSFLTL